MYACLKSKKKIKRFGKKKRDCWVTRGMRGLYMYLTFFFHLQQAKGLFVSRMEERSVRTKRAGVYNM